MVHTTRDLLLDAATEAVLSGADWDRVRMADVARSAGVSRQTLYYEFGSKDALAQAITLREAELYMVGADQARAGHDDTPGQAIAAAAAYTFETAAANPLLKTVLTDDTGGLLPFLTSRSQPLLTALDEHTAGELLARWPALDPELVRLVADSVNRLMLSHLVLPGGRGDQVAADLGRLVDALLPVPPATPTTEATP